ncbi:unnamed protein product [Sphagnum jensenii]
MRRQSRDAALAVTLSPSASQLTQPITRHSRTSSMSIASDTKITAQRKLRVLMLTWEYPPRMVGGLGRAVCGRSRALVALGCDVQVLTSTYPLAPKHSIDRGVHVHWLDHEHLASGKAFAIPEEGRFWIWLGRMNAAIAKEALRLHAEQPFDAVR